MTKVFTNGEIQAIPVRRIDSYFGDEIPIGNHALWLSPNKLPTEGVWVQLGNLERLAQIFNSISECYQQPRILQTIPQPGKLVLYGIEDTISAPNHPDGVCLVCNEAANTHTTKHKPVIALNASPANGLWIHARCAGEFASLLEEVPDKIDLSQILAEHI